MILEDRNNLCTAKGASPKECEELSALLSIDDENRFYSKAFQHHHWDGKYYFFNKRTKRFPGGLLSYVQTKYPNAQVVEMTKGPEVDLTARILNLVPRQDQIDLFTTALKQKRGIIQAPTGMGKSLLIAMLCRAISGPILIMTHTKTLLYQTVKVLEKETGEKVGIVGDGCCDIKRITLGLIKSVLNLDQTYYNTIQTIIVDECHRTAADQIYKLLLSIPAYYRFGLSADALDTNNVKINGLYRNLRVISCLGPIIAMSTVNEAKEEGIIATPKIKFKKIADPYRGAYKDSTYAEAYDKLVVENDNLELYIDSLCVKHNSQQTIILLKRIEHGKRLEARIPNAKFLYGELDSQYIQQEIENFKQLKYKVLIGSDIFREGVDIPEIDVLINAGSDVVATKQRLGRGLRKKKHGPNEVQVYDFYIMGNRYMEKHAKERLRIYLSEGHELC